MSTMQEVLAIKRRVAEYEAELNKARGAYDSAMERIRKDFGCGTLRDAKRKLVSLDREIERLTQEFETKLRAYEKEWIHAT